MTGFMKSHAPMLGPDCAPATPIVGFAQQAIQEAESPVPSKDYRELPGRKAGAMKKPYHGKISTGSQFKMLDIYVYIWCQTRIFTYN